MYLWIGLGIDNNSAYEIRNYCKMLNKDYNVSEQSFTLPQHVSLKQSFKTDDYKNIIFDLKNYFKNMKQFELKISNIGNIPGVIWLEIEENEILRKFHNDILNLLKDKYNINKIGFDGETFKFHSTLFQDVDNKEKINNLYEVIDKELLKNNNIIANKIYFGLSEIGTVGTYKVIDEIELKVEKEKN